MWQLVGLWLRLALCGMFKRMQVVVSVRKCPLIVSNAGAPVNTD